MASTPKAHKKPPARERWLFKNKAARDQLLRGLADSAAGRVRYLGSFSRYARTKAN